MTDDIRHTDHTTSIDPADATAAEGGTISRRAALGGIAAGASLFAASQAMAQSAVPADPVVGQMETEPNAANSLAADRPLAGKVAIVTGARANIGRGIAIGLAQMGADVLVHYHRPETQDQAEETARLAREAGAERTALTVGDLGQPINVTEMFDVAERELGGADILVNVAGAMVKKPIVDITDEDYQRCYNINEWGTFLCMREAARRLRNEGRIINIVTALVPALTPNYGAYGATKAANAQLVRTLSAEVGGEDRRITVNSVHPGPVDTPFYREPESDGAIAYAVELANMNRLGRVSDVVPLVQFLASPAAQWVTGESLYVTGGYTQA